jgi:hypothetical protein
LSHYEYERTLRDLLILPEISPAVGFPADTPAHGFDNVAGVLTMSALLFEKYERMSEELVDQALSVSKVELFEAQFEAESLEGSIGKATSTGWNLWSNGSVPALVTVPDDGLYRIRVSAYGQQAGPALPQMAIRVDEKDLLVTFVAAVGGASAVYEVMADLAAGEHSVSAAFLNDFYEADLGNDRNLIIDWLGVEGPYLPETQLKTEEADSGTVDAGTAPAQGLWTVPPGSAFQMEVAVAAGGTYEIQLRAEVNSSVQGEVPVTILEDGETLVTVTFPTNAGGLGTYEVTVQLEAGNPTIAVQIADDDCAAGDCELTLDWVRWVGPVPVPVMSESAAKLLTCVPQSGEDCVAEIIGSFARRAWRRPVTDEEMGFLTALVQLALSEGDSAEVGLSLAFRAILLSPHFLYRVETEPEEPSDDPRLLTDFELATRLAYFLWSTLPDEELLTWAEQGALQVDAILETQVHRMLADPRSNALIESFAGQWLHLRALDDVIRDSVQFPAFDEELAASMRRETELVFEELLHGDGSLLDLIDGHFTYVNARLGAFYGLPTFGEEDFRRVPTDGVQRGGLLTHGSILTVTSSSCSVCRRRRPRPM